MREQRWKQFFVRKREGIGPGLRKKLILFNLAGIVLLALITWSCAGFPLPTAKMEFRRLERANQLPPSEIVWIVDGASKDLLNLSKDDRSCFAVDGTELHMKGCWGVGVQGNRAVVARLRGERYIQSVPLEDGPALVPFSRRDGFLEQTGYWIEEGPGKTPEGYPAYIYSYHSFTPFLLFRVPGETADVELTVELDGGVHTCSSWRMENGVWLMGLDQNWRTGMEAGKPGDTAERESQTQKLPYTLYLYREDGSLLLEKSGKLGEG